MQTSKTLARLYCPNPKDPTEGLRQKANGVWERNDVCFEYQFFEHVPADAHDVPVDWVVCGSEREARWYRDGALRSL